jgi:hypothetical protein
MKFAIAFLAAAGVSAQQLCDKNVVRVCPDTTVLERMEALSCDFVPCPNGADGVVDLATGQFTAFLGKENVQNPAAAIDMTKLQLEEQMAKMNAQQAMKAAPPAPQFGPVPPQMPPMAPQMPAPVFQAPMPAVDPNAPVVVAVDQFSANPEYGAAPVFNGQGGCPQDKFRTCPDGTVLKKEPQYGCDFAPCPTKTDGVVDMTKGGAFSPLAAAPTVFGPLPPMGFGLAPVAAGTCSNHCGAKDPISQCWCDDSCALHGDCCADKDMMCGKPKQHSPAPAGMAMSCQNNCGLESKSQFGTCWCDAMCEKNGDCCADYKSACANTMFGAGLIGDNGLGFASQYPPMFNAPAAPQFGAAPFAPYQPQMSYGQMFYGHNGQGQAPQQPQFPAQPQWGN